MSSSPPSLSSIPMAAKAFQRGVLIVDHDASAAYVLADGMRSQGWRVKVVGSAEEALEVIGSFRPAAVVLDLVLPFMSGIILACQIKADPATRGVSVVAVADLLDGDTEKLVHDAGCMTCLKKPVDPDSVGHLLHASAFELDRPDERR